jgi:hypothetical protein
MLDCDPDPMVEVFADLEKEQIERTKHWVNTPGDVLERERRRAEELQHTRAKAAIRAEARSRTKRRPSRDASRSQENRELISRAAREAKSSVKMFCTFLDRDHVPLPRSLKAKGVKTWAEASGKTELRSILRGIKYRALSLDQSS